MYVCLFVCMHACIYVCMYVYVYVCEYVWICMNMYEYVWICVNVHVLYEYMYVLTYLYTCIYIYITYKFLTSKNCDRTEYNHLSGFQQWKLAGKPLKHMLLLAKLGNEEETRVKLIRGRSKSQTNNMGEIASRMNLVIGIRTCAFHAFPGKLLGLKQLT